MNDTFHHYVCDGGNDSFRNILYILFLQQLRYHLADYIINGIALHSKRIKIYAAKKNLQKQQRRNGLLK